MDHLIRNTNVALSAETGLPLKSLSNFQKHFRIPDTHSHSTQEFVAHLAVREVDSALDQAYQQIREQFELKRRQLSVFRPAPGTQAIQTPDFILELSARQSVERLDEVIFSHRFSHFSDLNVVQSDRFSSICGKKNWRLCFQFFRPFSVPDLIDALESIEDEYLTLDYGSENDWVEIGYGLEPKAKSNVRIYAEFAEIQTVEKILPRDLVDTYIELSNTIRAHSPPQADVLRSICWPA